jgi:uncharacterized coiled-coil protein SlyX
MFISKKKLRELEKRIADLEVQVQSQQKKNEELRMQALADMSFNIVMKESFNLKLLKFLYEKLNLEEPDMSYKF